MPNKGFLRRLLVLGERQALQDLIVYTELGQKATEILKKQLSSMQMDQTGLISEVRSIEKKGDDLTLALKSEITQGAVNSTLLGHLLNLVETCDDILDRSLYISREIIRMSHFLKSAEEYSDYVVTEVYPRFIKMLDINSQALGTLKQMLQANGLEELNQNRGKIERFEESVDDIKDDIIDRVYTDAKNLHYLVFTHILNMVHRIDDLLDDCEDASDYVITVSNSVNR